MTLRIAAAATTAVLLVNVLGAPVWPVMIGASLAYGLLLWRSRAARG